MMLNRDESKENRNCLEGKSNIAMTSSFKVFG